MSQGKRWLFTLNNYTEEEYEACIKFLEDASSYFIVGKERGENGTPHLQGYTELSTRYRFLPLKAKIGERSHLELARGTGASNREYCSKEGSFVERGRLAKYRGGSGEVRSGSSRDELGKAFIGSCTDLGITAGINKFSEDHPGAWFFSGSTLLRNLFALISPPERPNVCVWWYYGATGTGKSRKAYELLPGAYRKDGRTKWWTGYRLETACVIDDFAPQGIDIVRLLVWFDRYPCLVETKGDMLPLCVKDFIVTSNFSPEEVFSTSLHINQNVEDRAIPHPQLPALMRRIKLQCFD
ncbi:replication associated protein [Chifec virus UA13_119]|uniref:Replication associated protein n=1 Tax=Chifec virus UA13_119 TaxID=2928926 RepID=A0A8T9JJB4_9VIRU|nr:replication associated protein [Chifec virus UA13_119]